MTSSLTPKDIEYLDKAKTQAWDEIDMSMVETEEAAEMLNQLIIDKYHYDEYKHGMQ